jgi:hypothetical protein
LILYYPAFYPSSNIPYILSAGLNLIVSCYSIAAFRRTKLKGFLFLFLGCFVPLVALIARMTLTGISRGNFGGNYGAYQDYITILALASLVAQFLWAAGIILIIRHFLKFLSKESQLEASK